MEDFALAMRIYSIAGQAVTQGTVISVQCTSCSVLSVFPRLVEYADSRSTKYPVLGSHAVSGDDRKNGRAKFVQLFISNQKHILRNGNLGKNKFLTTSGVHMFLNGLDFTDMSPRKSS